MDRPKYDFSEGVDHDVLNGMTENDSAKLDNGEDESLTPAENKIDYEALEKARKEINAADGTYGDIEVAYQKYRRSNG